MKGTTVKQWIRVTVLAMLVAAGVLVGANAANAGDPSQWGAIGSGEVSFQD